MILFTIPCGIGVLALGDLIRRSASAGRLLAALVALALLPSLTAYGLDQLSRQPCHGIRKHERDAIEWLSNHADQRGRIMCEPALLGSVLPYYTGHQVIGGAFSDHSPLKHCWTCVGMERGFGYSRHKNELTSDDWECFIDVYNLAFLVVESDTICRQLDRLTPLVTKRETIGRLTIYEVARTAASYIVGGDAESGAVVEAVANRITVRKAPAGTFVLKYHHFRAMACAEPGASIGPVEMLPDPVPFIRIENPNRLKTITITVR